MSSTITHLFPRGVVTGHSFINRREERRELKQRILNGDHSWIASPRRYGKTSLLCQFLEDVRRVRKAKIYGCMINMMSVYDETEAQKEINRSIGNLLMELEATHKKVLNLATKYFGDRIEGVGVEFGALRVNIRVKDERAGEIKEILNRVDQLARDKKIMIVLVFDEFQQVTELKQYYAIEAAIRDAVQHAKNTVYIFSGSHRRILDSIFTSKERPFFKLCRPFELNRISRTDYESYIQECAVLQFKKKINQQVLERLLTITACHPYYVNALARIVFQEKKPPTEEDIDHYWRVVVDEEHHWISSTLSKLSINQLGLLKNLALNPTDNPTSVKYAGQTRISPSSIHQSLDVLLKEDLIHRKGNNYLTVVDPAIAAFLRR